MYRWLTPKALLGRPRTCRFVHTYHGHIFHSYYGPLKTRLFLAIEKTLALLITDRIVVISEQQRREINGEFGVGRADQFAVIPLGLDLGVFADWKKRGQSFREELGLGTGDILVGIVGRLTEIKNHELFLRAVADFKTRVGRQSRSGVVRFVVIGDGALRARLEQIAASLDLSEDVKFVGSRRNLEDLYPALDIVALTSLNEGTPLTLIEAMANARPVISTAVGGVTDLLGDPISEDSAKFLTCQRGDLIAEYISRRKRWASQWSDADICRVWLKLMGKRGNGEFHRYLKIAAGSASELEYHFLLACDLQLMNEAQYKELDDAVTEIKRMLAALIRKVDAERLAC